jgi:selenocysteine lyase/cysteine desulfurase
VKLENQRHLFDIPRDVAYLNCAYMSPLMRQVRDAGLRGLERKCHPWEITARDFFTGSESLRAAFAELVHARPDDVAIVAAASYGVSLAAANLPLSRGQAVLVVEDQFPSNYYPWLERAREAGASLHTVPRPADGDWTRAVLEAIHDRGNRIAIAALPQCHWTDGGLFDLVAVSRACRDLGIFLSLDVTQSAGAAPLDVGSLEPDFLTAATYKWLLGPYSLGLVYVSERWQREGRPLEQNWIHRRGAQDFARLVDYQDAYADGARRFDVGERSNFALVPAAEAAIRQILEWGVENISETVAVLTDRVEEVARAMGLEPVPRERRAPHYLGIKLKDRLPPSLPEALAREKVYVSIRGSSIRVTPHLYNDERDCDRLLEALETALRSFSVRPRTSAPPGAPAAASPRPPARGAPRTARPRVPASPPARPRGRRRPGR